MLAVSRIVPILRESTDEEMTIEAGPEKCVIQGQHNEFEMPGEDPSTFPDIPSFAEEKFHERRSAGFPTGLPTPKEAKALTMPGNDGFWFHDHQPGLPAGEPTGQANPEKPVAKPDPRPRDRALQDGQLLAQGQVFSGDTDSVREESPEKMEESKEQIHGSSWAKAKIVQVSIGTRKLII